MTSLIDIDYQLFHLINSGCQNAVFDWLLPILRDKHTWLPIYLFLFVFWVLNFGKKGLYFALAFALTVGMADATSSHLLKKTVRRLRPCQVLEQPDDMHLLVRCGSGYSFPSSHAANHFAMAVFLGLAFGKRWRWVKWASLFWATSIAFSQVYVGVHFPVDVAAGALLGSGVGYVFFRLSKLCQPLVFPNENTPN